MLTADSPSLNDNAFDGAQGQDTIDEPRALAKSLIESLNGPQDATLLTAIWDSSVQYQTKTQEILRDAHRSLSQLSQKVTEATKEAHQPERDWEKSQFETSMERLSAEKCDLEQSLQDSQSAIQSLSEQIAAMSQELAVLEREEAMENEAPPDQEIIKLSIYRSLGIDLLESANEPNVFSKCQIRSKTKNDIHTVDFEENKFSKFFYANLLWDMCT